MMFGWLAAVVLTFAPAGAPVGAPAVARAADLAPNTPYALMWHTGDAHWRVEEGRFLGIVAPDTSYLVARGRSDANGRVELPFRVPEDFGYLHDVELRSGDALGEVAAHQGFTVIPHLRVSPASGPPGTPISVTLTGGGYRFYQTVWHLLYDGAQTGWLSGISTKGTARAVIPAAGGEGPHVFEAIEGPTAPYLNGRQSPNFQPLIPQVLAGSFRVTQGQAVLPKRAAAQAPARVRATPVPIDPLPDAPPVIALDYASGIVDSDLAIRGRGFAAHANVTVDWETVVGNRLSGTGWDTVRRPIAAAVADEDGRFAVAVRTPDDLGGTHRIVARAAGDEREAASSYTIVPSSAEIEPAAVSPGGEITLHFKGVGYTETGNTYTVVLDNGYIGYGCGFNSQGDVTIKIRAPGRAGWHFVDVYPTIYTGQTLGPGAPPAGATVNGSYFPLPMLNGADHPGEALPTFHFAFRVGA